MKTLCHYENLHMELPLAQVPILKFRYLPLRRQAVNLSPAHQRVAEAIFQASANDFALQAHIHGMEAPMHKQQRKLCSLIALTYIIHGGKLHVRRGKVPV